ncbi:MAG: sulfatase-like hydrolase/transferase, partial [Bacteroidota bacterium]
MRQYVFEKIRNMHLITFEMNFQLRIKLLLTLGVGLLLLASCTSPKAPANTQADGPPNIIFIMADDHTTQGFGVYGSRLARLNPTPNIDRLAEEGMLFENA